MSKTGRRAALLVYIHDIVASETHSCDERVDRDPDLLLLLLLLGSVLRVVTKVVRADDQAQTHLVLNAAAVDRIINGGTALS